MRSSRIPGFYRLSPDARRRALAHALHVDVSELRGFDSGALTIEAADLAVENAVGAFGLPLGVGVNLLINGREVAVPMAVEEPSVVAAISNMGQLVRRAGGFKAEADRGVMIGQVQLVEVSDPDRAKAAIEAEIPRLMALAHSVHPRLVERGGGAVHMHVRTLTYDEPGQTPERMVVLHFHLDCVDAMGANMVNTVAERLAPELAAITGERVGLRILSNLASERLARASCCLRPEHLDLPGLPGVALAKGIASAYRFAWADPWRAATHNKGIMNGIDPVVIATGNDWRAIEAGAHAWAARDGQYRSLSRWTMDEDGTLHGSLELPIQAGTVGGGGRTHPGVIMALRLLGNPTARELAGVLAAVGLAQNLGALRALATEGIQRGHMRMHARTVAAAAGACDASEVEAVVRGLCDADDFSVERARKILGGLRT